MEQELLVEWLSESSIRSLIDRAREGLRAGDHVILMKAVRRARLLLSHALDSERSEGLGACAALLLQGVCLPYLVVLLGDGSTQSSVQLDDGSTNELAETVGVALRSPHLPVGVADKVLGAGFGSLLEGGVSEEGLARFLCRVFSVARPEDMEDTLSQSLSSLFSLLLSLLDHSPTPVHHLVLSSLLPLFITPSHPHRLTAVWNMLQEVWSGQKIVELHPLAFSLSLLCCFSDIFISRDHTSPFISAFPSALRDLCPLQDVRGEGVLWEVLLAGLHSSDPLDRKRAMYLLHRSVSRSALRLVDCWLPQGPTVCEGGRKGGSE